MNHTTREFTIVGRIDRGWRFSPYDERVVGVPNAHEVIEFEGRYYRKAYGHLCPDVTELVNSYWDKRQAEVDQTHIRGDRRPQL